MPVNDNFRIPRKTQKVTAVTPCTILQYDELIGNLPNRRAFGDRVPASTADEIPGQAFVPPRDRLKAIGVYLQTDFRPSGQRRSGSIMVKLWDWAGYPVFPPTEILYTTSGRPAEVEIDIENLINLNETIFEFEESIPLIIGQTYFFTITQTEGWSLNRPIYFATSGINYGPIQGDFWIWNRATLALSRQRTPITDMVFDSYVSITEMSVNLVGSGSGNLTDIQDALTVASTITTPQAGFGIVDFNKPFQIHGQCFLQPTPLPAITTDVFGDAPLTVGVGCEVGLSDAADLNIPLHTDSELSMTTGSGLDDLAVDSSAWVSVPYRDLVFTITVKTGGPGPPDNTFDWVAKTTDGDVVASGLDVTMVVAGNTLVIDALTGEEVEISWGAAVGHTLADIWTFYVAAWDFAIIRVATDRIRVDWGDPTDTLDCSNTGQFRLLEEGDAMIIPEYISQFSFRKHLAADSNANISITLWRTPRP